MSNVGFIGVGYMGYGMAKNLLKKHNVFIFAHKNRKPINKLKKIGAKELKSYNEIQNHKLDCLMICVTNTPVALNVAKKIKQELDSKTLVIDLTTHNKNGALKMDKIFKSKKISYIIFHSMMSLLFFIEMKIKTLGALKIFVHIEEPPFLEGHYQME